MREKEVDQLILRGAAVMDDITQLVREGETQSGQTELDDEAKQSSIDAFRALVNPELSISVATQIKFMDSFNRLLGFEMPELQGYYRDSMELSNKKTPDMRIVPTRLTPDYFQRLIAPARSRHLPGAYYVNPTAGKGDNALRLPDDGTVIAELSYNLYKTVRSGGKDYAARYKIPGGENVVDRADFEDDLLDHNKAIIGANSYWIFPSIDVRLEVPSLGVAAIELFNMVDPFATPEALINVQILHQAAGLHPTEKEMTDDDSTKTKLPIDFGNEFIYELVDGEPAENPSYMATVRLRNDLGLDKENGADRGRIGTYARQINSQRTGNGVRRAYSSI